MYIYSIKQSEVSNAIIVERLNEHINEHINEHMLFSLEVRRPKLSSEALKQSFFHPG